MLCPIHFVVKEFDIFLWNLLPWSQKYYLIDCVCMYCVFCERFFFFFCEMVRVICCLCWIIQNNSLNSTFSIFLFSKTILLPFRINSNSIIAGCSLDFRYTMFVHTRVYIYIGFACIWCPWLVRSIVSLLSLFTLGVLCLHFPRDYSYSRSSKLFCLLFGDSTHTGLEVGKIVFWKIFARWKRGYFHLIYLPTNLN